MAEECAEIVIGPDGTVEMRIQVCPVLAAWPTPTPSLNCSVARSSATS